MLKRKPNWLLCEHANEMPALCLCPNDCACRTDGICRNRVKQPTVTAEKEPRKRSYNLSTATLKKQVIRLRAENAKLKRIIAVLKHRPSTAESDSYK